MASNTRSGRKGLANASPGQQDVSSLSSLESLILAQAVYEFGANSWPAVAKLLSKHPLLSRPKVFFTPQSCSAIYGHLMKEAGLECSEANNSPHAPTNLNLAQKHYQARFAELRDLIIAEEVEFKRIVAEIDDIRSGNLDGKINTGVPPSPSKVSGCNTRELHNDNHIDLATPTPPKEAEIPSDLGKAGDSNGPASLISHGPALAHEEKGPEAQIAAEDAVRAEGADAALDASRPNGPTSPGEPDRQIESHAEETIANKGDVQEVASNEEEHPEAGVPPETDKLGFRMETETEEQVVVEALPDEVEQATPLRRRESKRKASDTEMEPTREKKRPREESEPVDDEEPGPSSIAARRRSRNAPTEEQVAFKRFQNVIGMLHSQISQHRNGNIFHNPIKNSEAPDYHEIVKRPMDLKTIKMRVKDSLIANSLEFQRDVYLMFANAMMYNRPGSDIYHMAEEMMLESEGQINMFRQTEGFVRGAHRI